MCDEFITVSLTQGKVAIIDIGDAERVLAQRWHVMHVGSLWYARSGRTYLHRFILEAPSGKDVDHINGNGLDNRRCNLRVCDRRLNVAAGTPGRKSTTGYRGVSLDKRRGIYRAYITLHWKYVYLGNYRNAEDAARAYDKAAREHFGVFARLNFPNE